jgi:2-polyprenyl-3-methyl-5-hydroxy-6-metoxy-1,4-benzoquinol methylase
VLQRLNVNAYGIEHSSDNIKECKRKKLNVDKVYLTELPVSQKRKFPLVVCNNFLEHQPKKKDYLSSLRDLVSDDGIFFTPELDDMYPFIDQKIIREIREIRESAKLVKAV